MREVEDRDRPDVFDLFAAQLGAESCVTRGDVNS
jgi:hypothetical protein